MLRIFVINHGQMFMINKLVNGLHLYIIIEAVTVTVVHNLLHKRLCLNQLHESSCLTWKQ